MFIPILTPIYGMWTRFTGESPLIDGIICGKTEKDGEVNGKNERMK